MERCSAERLIEIFTSQDWTKRSEAIKRIEKEKEVLKRCYERAKKGKLGAWRRSPRGKLALILIYDQVPRVIFRDERAYATDKLARELTRELYESGEYRKLSDEEQLFAFLPFHHSERLEEQKIANRMFKRLYERNPKRFEWIYRASCEYVKIIAKHGAFPHRKKIPKRKR